MNNAFNIGIEIINFMWYNWLDEIWNWGRKNDYGARPLRRVIEQEIEDKLADEILSGKLTAGAKVTVDADIELGKLKFRIYQPKTGESADTASQPSA